MITSAGPGRAARTLDGKYVAVGAIEEPFWRQLLDRLGLDAAEALAEHTSQILTGLGYSPGEIGALQEAAVIPGAPGDTRLPH